MEGSIYSNKTKDPGKETARKPSPKWLVLLLVLISVGAIFIYGSRDTLSKNPIEIQAQKRLQELKDKLKSEELDDEEWEELCNLLTKVEGIFINDCLNCRHYVKAFFQIKHYNHFKNYEKRPDKELEKGIRKYQRRIDEHYDKIADPRKYFPDWDNYHPNRRIDLVENHWPNDIRRLNEQKEILECILLNR